MERSGAFLFMAYLASIDGLTKLNKSVRSRLRGTDFNRAQSNIYRHNGYYHTHGSLIASPVLEMIGLPAYREDFTDEDYPQILEYIGEAVGKFTVDELEKLYNDRKLAGIMAITQEEFLSTPYGKALSKQPYWNLEPIETTTPLVLNGIRVLELCRIIAGPTVTRILAEYGAKVLKITSSTGPDVPFFQVDGNVGKHAAELDLKTLEGRKILEGLLETADVIVDGYRPGAIEKPGYGPLALKELAWAQGRAMGRNELIIPPFPLSDYGTGCMGAIAALTGLYYCATKGGSYWGKASLVQYDITYLMAFGEYPNSVWQDIVSKQDPDAITIRMPGFGGKIKVVRPVVKMGKTWNGFNETSRPNGWDQPRC
ncbi:CoA-transferase family III domain-containing protein [Trichophaea hybrida]|nr:CoA-transferase family III domain-containing protein [Trichophaea hybrida]